MERNGHPAAQKAAAHPALDDRAVIRMGVQAFPQAFGPLAFLALRAGSKPRR